MIPRGAGLWLLLAVGTLTATPTLAAGQVTLSARVTEYAGLRVDGLELSWTGATRASGRVRLRAGRVAGFAATGPFSKLAVDCAALEVSGDQLNCARGRLSGTFGALGDQNTSFSAHMRADGSLMLRLDTLAIAGGRGGTDLQLRGANWRLEARLEDLDVATLAELARPWLKPPGGLTLAGRASGRAAAAGRGDVVRAVDVELAIAALGFADAEGAQAGEALGGRLRAKLEALRGGDYRTEGDLMLSAGQAYSEPLFLDFGARPIDLQFDGLLAADGARFEARSFSLVHRGVAEISGTAVLDLAGDALLERAALDITGIELASALPLYVQPYLIDTAFKDLAGEGRLHGQVDIAGNIPVRAALDFERATLASEAGSLSVRGLTGRLHWFDDARRSELAGRIDDAGFESRLAWESASLWGIRIGATELPFTTSGRHFRLLQPVLLPIFDGGLAVDTLRIRHAGTEQMYVRFDAALRPISLTLLSRALGWPEFAGTIAGRIPNLQMSEGVVTLDGDLEARAFDGRIVVRDLELRDALGQYPRLHASLDFDQLDLEQVTGTFSFGMITGRLSGRIEDLETFAWMPESFDARFYTPPDDRSAHRISQRAVTNLSSIGGGSGGGVAAALQGGFLRFFDSFRYDRLGLSCRLVNDVCTMGGIERPGGGYYIVKGAGLPRINVIGSQSRVAWSRLVGQLAAIMESEIVVE